MRYQTYVLHLIDGTAIPMVEDYDRPAEKGIVGHLSLIHISPSSENSSKSARGTSDGAEKPSVRQELRDIQAQRKKEAEAARAEEPAAPQKKAAQKTTRHQPPKPKKKPKSKER